MNYQADVVIAGGGIAGIVTALELLDHNKSVVLLDRDKEENFGGLAKESFGGIFMVNTPQQRFGRIKDSPELALQDWLSFAEFDADAHLPRQWVEKYVHQSRSHIYDWLRKHSVGFFPVVHWVERGLDVRGNSVPRFHMVWGTGHGLMEALIHHLNHHKNRKKLQLHFNHRVTEIISEDGRVTGVQGISEESGAPFEAEGDAVVIASGGICGAIERVKENWYKAWGKPPKTILNGSHHYAIGDLHDAAAKLDANLTHMDKQWHYAAGITHPEPIRPNQGLSLVPPKSALWVNYRGERIGPTPLISGFDTRYLVERIVSQEEKYSWQIMNWKIAVKEMAISGSEFNHSIREKKVFGFLKDLLLGNKKLVQYLVDKCEDVVIAHSPDELVEKMNAVTGKQHVEKQLLQEAITNYDNQIKLGPDNTTDEQIKRIAQLRQYRGDRTRTCKFQPISEPMPFVAIREFILSRKSLGGIQTDLQCRVLSKGQTPIEGLYAVGEAAGFGGGGIHGLRALEGTFLGGCILTGRTAGQSIVEG